ncbi:hypothetical protein B0H12DRAFT_1126966 [Mycena haematopus]|nr:hypothetical protein B0H12DRAFT_1126966 [Mycena haematopus]
MLVGCRPQRGRPKRTYKKDGQKGRKRTMMVATAMMTVSCELSKAREISSPRARENQGRAREERQIDIWSTRDSYSGVARRASLSQSRITCREEALDNS